MFKSDIYNNNCSFEYNENCVLEMQVKSVYHEASIVFKCVYVNCLAFVKV